MEAFFGWYSGNRFERFMIGTACMAHTPVTTGFDCLHIVTPQFLWIKKVRSNLLVLWLISIVVSIGMWLERFVIVVTSLHVIFCLRRGACYQPSMWTGRCLSARLDFSLPCCFLFIRFLPMISIFEMRTILPEAEVEE